MTGEAARQAFLAWLAEERRASPHTVEAYGRDIRDLLEFLTKHQGGAPDLAALRLADLRGFLAARANAGLSNASRARQLAAVRGFLRFLARQRGLAPVALAGLRGPRRKPPTPRALSPGDAREVGTQIGAVRMTEATPLPHWQAARDAALFTLLYGWVAAGFVTALMGYHVLRRGDVHTLSHARVAHHPIAADARTAIVTPGDGAVALPERGEHSVFNA
jgi:integrase/recombinase XerC